MSTTIIGLPQKWPLAFSQLWVTECADNVEQNASFPRIVFPVALFPLPVLPTRMMLSWDPGDQTQTCVSPAALGQPLLTTRRLPGRGAGAARKGVPESPVCLWGWDGMGHGLEPAASRHTGPAQPHPPSTSLCAALRAGRWVAASEHTHGHGIPQCPHTAYIKMHEDTNPPCFPSSQPGAQPGCSCL